MPKADPMASHRTPALLCNASRSSHHPTPMLVQGRPLSLNFQPPPPATPCPFKGAYPVPFAILKVCRPWMESHNRNPTSVTTFFFSVPIEALERRTITEVGDQQGPAAALAKAGLPFRHQRWELCARWPPGIAQTLPDPGLAGPCPRADKPWPGGHFEPHFTRTRHWHP